MNNLCTLLNAISKNDLMAQDLDDLCNLVTSVVREDLGSDSKSLITSWADNNAPYVDFVFAIRPEWLEGTPDDKQIKMNLSVDAGEHTWYAYMVMDCEDGECESWGEQTFHSDMLADFSMPVKSMIEAIRKQYDERLREERAREDSELSRAVDTVRLLAPHVEAMKRICKERGITLHVDHSLDGSNCIYAVPSSVESQQWIDKKDEIPLDRIPYVDLDARGFDPNYDHFVHVK
jgi:hypothetical protein